MDNIKSFKINEYSLIYHTNVNECLKSWYWYNDINDILCKYNCAMITSIEVPFEIDYDNVKHFLEEFCDIMSIENKVILFDIEELMHICDLEYMYYIEELLVRCNFIPIPIDFMHSSDTYVYLNIAGANVIDEIDIKNGVYYD